MQVGFNPRARAGRDVVDDRGLGRRCCFNPRARAGRDVHRHDRTLCAVLCFNPRARAGRDARGLQISRR